jgi:hypothetical protein
MTLPTGSPAAFNFDTICSAVSVTTGIMLEDAALGVDPAGALPPAGPDDPQPAKPRIAQPAAASPMSPVRIVVVAVPFRVGPYHRLARLYGSGLAATPPSVLHSVP